MSSPFDSKFDTIRNKIIYYADQWGIPRNVAIWQIWKESKYNPNVCSYAGACGIAQFMPATAARFGLDNPYDIDDSLDSWGEYMSWLLRQPYINGDISLALAGYNAGEGNVQNGRWKHIAQTTDYVNYIMSNAGATSSAMTATINATYPSAPDPSGDASGVHDLVASLGGGVDIGVTDTTGAASSTSNFTVYAVFGLIGIVGLIAISK